MLDRSTRTIFDEDAELYDEMRPAYPEALIKDVLELSEISQRGRILEIGCGTGQATIPFVQRGFSMLCLDLGANMISVARRKSRCFTNVDFLAVSFEEWLPEEENFDLVISATAFHWIAPEIRYSKAAAVLRDRGSVAIFSNLYPDPDSEFFRAVQNVYRTCVPEWTVPGNTGAYKSDYESAIIATEEEINATGLFEKAVIRRYPWAVEYSADDYVKLLDTYSDHRALKKSTKQKLFTGIVQLINQFGGTVTKPYLAVLWFAKKRPVDSPT